jgi:hypothetical protein
MVCFYCACFIVGPNGLLLLCVFHCRAKWFAFILHVSLYGQKVFFYSAWSNVFSYGVFSSVVLNSVHKWFAFIVHVSL